MTELQSSGTSRAGILYERAYAAICGTHPDVRFWHFHWLAVKDLYRDLRAAMPQLHGRLLDIGCGDKPYRNWLPNVTSYTGVDVYGGPEVDIVIEPFRAWPLEADSFDTVICTQVMEHARDLPHLLSEIGRVLAPQGTLLATVPFAYNEHGAPDDYRRMSAHGVRALLEADYEIVSLRTEGGIGSTVGLLVLNWIDATLNLTRTGRLLKGLLLPLWIVLCMVVNAAGWLMDRLDRTGAFYSNVFVIARRRMSAVRESDQ